MVAPCNHKYSRPRRRDELRRGFTMVELLVVIVVILLLMSLLVPTLSGARRAAKKAATLSLMQSVSTGITLFKQNTGRLPGHFSQEQLGHPRNQERGLTVMENALVELAGGALPSNAQTPSGSVSIIKLFYGEAGDPALLVDTSLIGDPAGPAYLNLPKDIIKPVAGQYHGQTVNSGMDRMPDIVDPFGMPLLLWVKNKSAGRDAAFASEYAVPNASRRSLFYLTANAGMLRSDKLGSPGPVDQCRQSVLGWPAIGNAMSDPVDRVTSLTALLGHPQLPILDSTNPYGDPGAPLGEAVIQSAGADRIYLSNDHGAIRRAVYQMSGTDSNDGNQLLGGFDDLILPAGE